MNIQNLWHALAHSTITIIAFGIPLVIMQGGDWQSLTLGSILSIVGNWAKIAYASPAQQK